jgi:hypothetical protein
MSIENYIVLAKESKDYSNEELEVNWLEPLKPSDRTGKEHCVNRGSLVIADGLEEQEAYRLLDELQAVCGENK